ncbi:hypothetical protein JCM1841_002995 [Sporobolomyces salmonicolor]
MPTALDSSIGAFAIGAFLSCFLAGITMVQVVEYFMLFGLKDKRVWLCIVCVLAVADIFHTAMSCYTIFVSWIRTSPQRFPALDGRHVASILQLWSVMHFGDLAYLVTCPWSFTWYDPALTGVVTAVVQLFYAYRVFVISKKQKIVPSVVCALTTLQLAFAIGSTWMITKLKFFALFGEFKYGVGIWLMSAAAGDIIITSSMIHYLRGATRREYQHGYSIIGRLLINTIETNALTMMVAIVDAILFITMSYASWHVIANLCLVKLYFNGVLVSRESSPSSFEAEPRLTPTFLAAVNSRKPLTEGHTSGAVNSRTNKAGPGYELGGMSGTAVVTPSTFTRSHGGGEKSSRAVGGRGSEETRRPFQDNQAAQFEIAYQPSQASDDKAAAVFYD